MFKKGLFEQYRILILMGILLGCIMLFYFFYSLLVPPIATITGIGVTAIQAGVANEPTLSVAVNNTIVPANQALGNLEWISYSLLIVMLITFVMIASFVRTYPYLLPVWIGICVILVFVSIVLSNAYESSVGDNSLWASYATNSFYMGYLPYIMTAIGLLGGVILLAIVSREQEAQVTI